MAFSQSLFMGDDTIRELENCEKKQMQKPTTPDLLTPPSSKKRIKCNNKINCDQTKDKPGRSDLDVIDESPTEKSSILGQSIKDRLRNVSSSSKSKRKYLRRSKSDPLTKEANKSDENEHMDKYSYMHGFSENFSSLLDSTSDFQYKNEEIAAVKNGEIKENTFHENIDHFFQESVDWESQLRKLDHLKSQNKPTENFNLNEIDENLCDDFFESKFTLENENINVSKIESLLRSFDDKTGNQVKSEDIFKETDPANNQHEEQLKVPESMSEQLRWDESEFFNSFHEAVHNSLQVARERESEAEKEVVNTSSADTVELDHSLSQFIAGEMEVCKLDVSEALSILDENIVLPMKNESIRNTSRLTQSFNTKNVTDAVPIPARIDKNIESLADWGFPQIILNQYQKKGIKQMFDWQAECLNKPNIRHDGRNFVYSAPTSAGKTFVSEVLMINSVLKKKRKVLIILPFISVVREKMYYLQDLLRPAGIRVEGFFGGHSPPGGFETVDIAVCTIEKANSIVNKLLEQNKITTIGLIVVDEVHLISDPGRGYILELLLAKTLFCSRKLETNIQVITMSATLPNADLLRKWLDAEYYLTDFRPVELREMIKIGSEIYDNHMNLVRTVPQGELSSIIQNDPDNVGQLCIETIVDSSAVIVFCPSKDWCESLALHVAGLIYKIGKSQTEIGGKLREQINMQLIEEVKLHLRNCPTGLDSVLEKTISYGVAFHHAGLTFDERDIIESAFGNGSLRVIIATSTLSSGVNLPARRVIIRSPLFAGKPMSALTYKQMIGRAGRMGKDTIGESILICANNTMQAGKELIGAELKTLSSCLGVDNCAHLKRAILEIIASGMATTKNELEAFIKCTLLFSEGKFDVKYFENENITAYMRRTRSGKVLKSSQTENSDKNNGEKSNLDPIAGCMQFLEEYEFIRIHFNEDTHELNYVATRLGHACLASSMPPSDGFLLFSELQKARQCFVLENELHAVYLVTPFSVCYQLQEIDWLLYLDLWEKLPNSMRQVGNLVGVKESFLVRAMRGNIKCDYRMLQIHKRFYTALALQELVNEASINDVAAKYKFTRGVLQSLQQTTSTFAGIVTSFCYALNWQLLAMIVSQFKERLFFGVHQDLIDLMKISILNNQRARALFDAGFQTLVHLANADTFSIEKCLYNCISFDTKKRDGENNYDAKQRNKLRSLFVTGKSGLTVEDAARLLIEEARHYLESEIGVGIMNWSDKAEVENLTEPNEENKKNGTNEAHTKNVAENIENEDDRIDKTFTKDQESTEITNKRRRKSIHPEASSSTSLNNSKKQLKKKTVSKKVKKRQVDSNDGLNNVDSVNIHSLESNNNATAFAESDSLILESSHILSDKHVDEEICGKMTHVDIIDVFKSLIFFEKFKEVLEILSECSLSLVIRKRCTQNKEEDTFRCIISEELYIGGVMLSIDQNIAYYLNMQDDERHQIHFNAKVEFISEIFSREKFTLKILDAKNQLRLLLTSLPEIDKINCSLEDPNVGHWLLQPDIQPSFQRMVLLYAPECVALSQSISDTDISNIDQKYCAAVQACVIKSILNTQMQNLNRISNGAIHKAFTDMEMPIQKSLLKMEMHGIAVSREAMENLNMKIIDYMSDLEAEMYRLHGKRFQINSSHEVARILNIRDKTKGTTVTKCSRADIENSPLPIAKLLLEYRKLSGILAKTIQPLLRRIIGDRIYGNSISFTSTGRISMHEPNLQNVAKDFNIEFLDPSNIQELSCRSAFKTEPGRELISADFCQLELRVLAHLSEDETLIEIFNDSRYDIFTSIAAKWNRLPARQITESQRNDAKQICYGIIYGMGIKSLAQALKCDENEALNRYESFHQTYPGIRNYTQKIIDLAKEQGFVETLAGRRRYFSQIKCTDDISKRNQAERQAINTTIQGSAADIAKYAILRMERNICKYQNTLKINISSEPNSHVNLVLHLHDELMYEVPVEKSKQIVKILRSSMENCAKLRVPLCVKVKKGLNWGTMTPVE